MTAWRTLNVPIYLKKWPEGVKYRTTYNPEWLPRGRITPVFSTPCSAVCPYHVAYNTNRKMRLSLRQPVDSITETWNLVYESVQDMWCMCNNCKCYDPLVPDLNRLMPMSTLTCQHRMLHHNYQPTHLLNSRIKLTALGQRYFKTCKRLEIAIWIHPALSGIHSYFNPCPISSPKEYVL